MPDEIANSADGIYKTLQVKYGCGSDVTQMVWYNAREMTKYDENYAQINAEVAAMGNVIQAVPPAPLFDDYAAEDAGLLQTPPVRCLGSLERRFPDRQKVHRDGLGRLCG